MTIYTHFVYWIHLSEHDDIHSQGYIGVTGDLVRRKRDHQKEAKSLTPKNIHLARAITKYTTQTTVLFQGTKQACYEMEYDLRPKRNIGWNIQKGGKIHTDENIAKRSTKLKGREFTKEWRKKISDSKIGSKNGMYGKNIPCSEDKRIAIIKSKHKNHYEIYKNAIELMNDSISADIVAKKLNLSRGVCFRLKNRTHLFFKAFPELI